MAEELNNPMQCTEFDALLGDALDGSLSQRKRQEFDNHAASCAICGPLLREAEAGRAWLQSLAPAEPPAELVRNVLLATTGQAGARHASWWEQFVESTARPVLAFVRQPRFVMSFGMAFFSLSMCLSLAGVRITDVRAADFRPSAIERNYFEASGRVVKYYDNIRFVYEIESRLRDFKRMTAPAETAPREKKKDGRDNTSGRPEPKEDHNYGQRGNAPMLMEASEQPAEMSVPGRAL